MSDQRIITPEQLKAEQFNKELESLMVKYGFALVPTFSFDGSQLQAGIKVMPKPRPVEVTQ